MKKVINYGKNYVFISTKSSKFLRVIFFVLTKSFDLHFGTSWKKKHKYVKDLIKLIQNNQIKDDEIISWKLLWNLVNINSMLLGVDYVKIWNINDKVSNSCWNVDVNSML